MCNIWFRLFVAQKGYYDKIVELQGESPNSHTLAAKGKVIQEAKYIGNPKEQLKGLCGRTIGKPTDLQISINLSSG